MSDSQDQSEKTEDPTQKKLSDARDKGQVAKSKEFNTWLILTTATLLILTIGPSIARTIGGSLVIFIEQPHMLATDFDSLRGILMGRAVEVAWALGLTALLLMVAAVAAGVMQHGFVWSTESLKPQLSRLSLIEGFKRQFSLKQVVEFLKSILKLAVVAAVGLFVILPYLDTLPLLITMEPAQTLDYLYGLALKLLAGVIGAMAVITAIDIAYQRFEFTKQQRMSRRDIKDELKQSEGDPMVKARLRAVRMERARQRMMAAVPEADVVVTNPTHYAVALKYDEVEMEAPTVVAKGADFVAKRIRELAQENDVPIVENPPLARALFQAEVNQVIPADTYRAVAEVISYVWRIKGYKRRDRAQSKTSGERPQRAK
jgi:flagellar biosynthetic protein FlhB